MNRMGPLDQRGLHTFDKEADCCRQGEVRIGMVNYINTAPIYEVWKRYPLEPGWHVLEAPPSTLNKLLADGDLDLGFVSSFEYARNPQRYYILPDLSISANGPVGSVFLFSKKEVGVEKIHTVLLSNQSETSVALVKIILEEFYQIKPSYSSGAVTRDNYNNCCAVLAIGDDALRLRKEDSFGYCLDLGEVWSRHTGLPFVFAVCAVQRTFVKAHSELLMKVYERLLSCREEGCKKLMDICRAAAPRIPMEVADCYAYLKGIEYDLGTRKRDALESFFHI